MRIFLSFLQSQKKHPIPAYDFWGRHLKGGIEEAGHEWVEAESVDWAEGLVHRDKSKLSEWRSGAWESTVRQVKAVHKSAGVDLFLAYFYPQQIDTGAIDEIQRLGIPCVNFFCDNVREFRAVPAEFYCFDLHWVPELAALEMYKNAGLRYVHSPMPVWIAPQLRGHRHPENYGVSFIGSRDVLRERLIAQALQLGAKIELRGTGWGVSPANKNDGGARKTLSKSFRNQLNLIRKDGIKGAFRKLDYRRQPRIPETVFHDFVRPSPGHAEYVSITQQSLVTLGINRYPSFRYSFSSPGTYSRLRDIEAPMMGACYLTEWTSELDGLYELGEEIETYRTAEEMVEKIRELEADATKRTRLRCKGQKRALSDHTIAKSMDNIAATLSLGN
jgi:hypothetical protein